MEQFELQDFGKEEKETREYRESLISQYQAIIDACNGYTAVARDGKGAVTLKEFVSECDILLNYLRYEANAEELRVLSTVLSTALHPASNELFRLERVLMKKEEIQAQLFIMDGKNQEEMNTDEAIQRAETVEKALNGEIVEMIQYLYQITEPLRETGKLGQI